MPLFTFSTIRKSTSLNSPAPNKKNTEPFSCMFSRSIAAAASHFSSHSTDSKPWVQTFNKLCRCHFFSIFTWLCSCKPSTVNRCRCPTKLSLPSCHLILQVAIHQLVITPSVESTKVVYGGSKWTIFFGGCYCCILAFLSSSSLYSDELKKANVKQ